MAAVIAVINTIITWSGLVALACAVAILVFRLPVFPFSLDASSRSEPVGLFTRTFLILAMTVIGSSSLAELLLRSGEAAPGFPEGTSLTDMVLHTRYGTAWLIRMATAGLLAILIPFSGKSRDDNALSVLMLALAVVLAWTYTLPGHGAEQSGSMLRQAVNLLHLLAAALWTGGVFVLLLLVLPSSLIGGDVAVIAEVNRIFSRMVCYAILILVVTAAYDIRVNVAEFKQLWSTGYGVTVLVKIFLFYLAALFGAFNRYVSVPLLLHVAGARLEVPGPFGRFIGILLERFRLHLTLPVTLIFRKALLLQAVVMAAILLCASALKYQTPPGRAALPDQERIEGTSSDKLISDSY